VVRYSNGGPFEGLAAVLGAIFAGATLYGLTSRDWSLALGAGAMFAAMTGAWAWSHRLGEQRRRGRRI
jgi:hypothetical protein